MIFISRDHPTPPLAFARVDPPPPGEGKSAFASQACASFQPKLSNSQASSFSLRDFRASVRLSFRFRSLWGSVCCAPPQKGGARLCSQERERSAARRIGIGACSAKSTCRPCDRPARLTALHHGVIRWWDPSAPPACPGSLGPDHLTRRRDGRFHPRLRCEPGGLLHTSPEGRLAKPARGAPSPFTSRIACRTPLKRMGIRLDYSPNAAASSRIKNYFLPLNQPLSCPAKAGHPAVRDYDPTKSPLGHPPTRVTTLYFWRPKTWMAGSPLRFARP